jgi:putative hemolysin
MLKPLPLILIIFALIILSGFFSLFDSALNTSRKTRLQKESHKHYRSLLKALENTRVLTLACRMWISILRVLAAFLTGANVMRYFEMARARGPSLMTALVIAACALVLGAASVLLGDVLPKLISHIAPEKIAAALLPLMKALCLPLKPFSVPVGAFAAFFRSAFHLEAGDSGITEDELRHALMEGEKSGIVESKERTMVEGVFYFGDRPVGAFMTHRSEIEWLDCNAPYEEIYAKAMENRSQRCFPVVSGSPDEIIGTVYIEDIILDHAQPSPLGLRAIMQKAQFVPETMSALKAFESFKQGQAGFLFVMDEYGGLAGIISVRALIEEIVGELSVSAQEEEPLIRQEDGSWLADGMINIDDAAKALSLTGLPEDGDFHTLAGFVLSLAGELPRVGDSFEYQGYTFKVKEMDGHRIDKLLISKNWQLTGKHI